MFPEIRIAKTNNNSGNGKDKNKDHADYNRPADKV